MFGRQVWIGVGLMGLLAGVSTAQERVVYKCPDNLYTDTITPKEATTKGCKPLEGAPITVIQGPAKRVPATSASNGAGGVNGASSPRPSDSRVDPSDQRVRDADKRRILESELRREEERLAGLKQEFNNGQPERRGDERNYQKYLDRTAELKANIDRSESDIAALKREITKLGAVN